MNRIFYKIVSVLMAVIVFMSTISLTIDMHYCGSVLVDTSILNNAESCGMEQVSKSSKECSVMKKNCCSDEQIIIEGQDELKISFDNLSFDQQVFVSSFVYSYINLFEGLKENTSSITEYPPPLIVRPIYKLDEVYLI